MAKNSVEKFKIGDREFTLELGLDTVGALEKELAYGLGAIMSCMASSHLATTITVMLKTVKKGTEVGYQPIDPEDCGLLIGDPDAGFTLAFGRAVEALGNAYGLVKTSEKVSSPG